MKDLKSLPFSQLEKIAEANKEKNLKNANLKARTVNVKNTFYTRYGKRFLDVVISLIAVIVTLPINFFLAIATFKDVGRPIFFKQTRQSKDGRSFQLVKFRNMTNETDENGELLPPEKRVTKLGKFVRKTSIDELLNFWSILKGDMSVIGPRPLPTYYTGLMTERHKHRTAVRPGLECPSLRSKKKNLSWQERFENDVWYVEHCSFLLDLVLCFRVVQITLFPENEAERASGDAGAFIGYDSQGKAISITDLSEEEADGLLKPIL